MKRVCFTIDESVIERFDNACGEAGLTRSQYLGCLLSGRIDIRPPVFGYKALIQCISSIERDLKAIALREELSDNDRILILEKLVEIKQLLEGRFGTGNETKTEIEEIAAT
ncbi:MAG: hypothetical protein K6E75_03280 [Lachnospiraceae bacterium]|nr:hypothetical protein [Lachnospiraceae bacterium]